MNLISPETGKNEIAVIAHTVSVFGIDLGLKGRLYELFFKNGEGGLRICVFLLSIVEIQREQIIPRHLCNDNVHKAHNGSLSLIIVVHMVFPRQEMMMNRV